jgi:hypothetical protein
MAAHLEWKWCRRSVSQQARDMLRFSRMRLENQSSPDGQAKQEPAQLWCAICARVVSDPLVCGDCSAVICRVCGTPLESSDELAFG